VTNVRLEDTPAEPAPSQSYCYCWAPAGWLAALSY